MMHTFKSNRTTFIFNGDYSGEVKILDEENQVTVDSEDLVAFVAQMKRSKKISELEQTDDSELLGLG